MVTSDHLRDARIVVVGAGVIGATQAYRLAQAGAEVTVVERRHTGAGTTGATFAWINGVNKPPRHYERMNVQAIRDHEDLAAELEGDWVHIGGTILWAARDDATKAEHYRTALRRSMGWGTRVDRIDATTLGTLEPDLALHPDSTAEIHLVHRTGWIDPIPLAHAALRAAQTRYGASLERAEVTGFDLRADTIVGVRLLDGRTLGADVVMDCAGPDAPSLAALAGLTLPVERIPGVILTSTPVPVRLRHVLQTPFGNARPDGGGRLALQWEPLDTLVAGTGVLGPAHPEVLAAYERLSSLLPGLRAGRVEAVRIGIRSVPNDGRSIVGFDPRVGNLYHVVTHSGVTLSARLALLVTEELSGGGDEALAPYRPDRLLSSTAPT